MKENATQFLENEKFDLEWARDLLSGLQSPKDLLSGLQSPISLFFRWTVSYPDLQVIVYSVLEAYLMELSR